MARSQSMNLANAFWQQAGGRAVFGSPVDVERAASRALPVAILRVSELTTGSICEVLDRIGADPWLDDAPRTLRGCLIADTGAALVLVDDNDPEDEQRMTIAHELAHLLLHYFKPREEAVAAFGTRVLAVLDRTRSSTHGERLSAVLRNVPIEPFRHAMVRRQPHLAGRVAEMEDDADDLAVELLAPWREVRSMSDTSAGAIRDHFGLPAPVAVRLAAMIQPTRTSSDVIALFGKKTESKS